MQRSKHSIFAFAFVVLLALSLGMGLVVESVFGADNDAGIDERYRNPETGYTVVIDDSADLLTDDEESRLIQDMIPITEYGHCSFVSCEVYATSTATFAKDWYYNRFGNDDGTAFVIDMGNRNIYIVSGGLVYRTVTKGYANSITDNVYTYATREDYYTCAAKAFEQEATILEGGRIARPMKHITNFLVAAILAIVINYIVARGSRMSKQKPERAVFNATTFSSLAGAVTGTKFVKSITYTESDDDDDGGFIGGGFSGGGFSGGGGGHSF